MILKYFYRGDRWSNMGSRRALFLVLEGIDGSGKATQTSYLSDWLEGEGLEVATYELPGESPAGKLIKRCLKGEEPLPLPEEFALLYASDRFHHLPGLLEDLQVCDVVIFDRYTGSNMAYQSARVPPERRDFFLKWLKRVEEPLPGPDLTIFLDMEPEAARRLAEGRGGLDRNEAWLEYQREVYTVYLKLSEEEGWVRVRCTEGGEILPPEKVHEAIREVILGRFPQLFHRDG